MDEAAKSSNFLISLLHHRWAVPVIAEISKHRGRKFVTLANRLRVSRDSLSRTLDALIELGLVTRNPGHGHPMRPEYILTDRGERIGRAAVELIQALRTSGCDDACLRKWSLPVLNELRRGELRFGELRARLSGMTPRALSLTLETLAGAELVARVEHVEGPAGCYRLTPAGKEIADSAAVLAQCFHRVRSFPITAMPADSLRK